MFPLNQMMNVNWKKDTEKSIMSSIAFFSNKSKFERERWVVERLLIAFSIPFKKQEMREGPEPFDVYIEGMNFQVKELYEPERKRGLEFQQKLQKLSNAKTLNEMFEPYRPKEIAFRKIEQIALEYAGTLTAEKYAAVAREQMDLLFYFNWLDYSVTPPKQFKTRVTHDFRSISLVTNSHVCILAVHKEKSSLLNSKINKYSPHIKVHEIK